MTADANLASEILVLIGHDPATTPPSGAEELFRRLGRDQLLECARRLGLTGISKLGKEALAARVQLAFERLPPAAETGAAHAPVNGAQNGAQNGTAAADKTPAGVAAGTFPGKFDLGPDAKEEALPEHIPWGYGHDRVTAMYVNPERLYAYWEVTDAAIEVARRQLGRGGANAWLNVRVYDITGRLFDGTNAHSYFDHRLERHDRQWFFDINKPTSTACVEVGLLSPEGYFAKIARSGRVEFPRREPIGGGHVEWLTVRTASGPAGEPQATGGSDGGGPGAYGPGGHAGNGGGALGGNGHAGWSEWTENAGFPVPGGHRVFERRWEWQEASADQWQSEVSRTEWVGPTTRTEWESGPFSTEVEPPTLVEQRDTGEVSVRTQNGQVHVVYGPWQVVIRGIGARAERRVLATWEYKRTVAVTGGTERAPVTWRRVAPGSSEWMAMGASERAWVGASELVFRGASELFMIGASELRLRGASESLYAGASEYRYRGASERVARGASEWSYRGASERLFAGSSERLYGGASEQHLGGGSERSYPPLGASENAPARGGGGDDRGTNGGDAGGPLPYPET